MSGFELFWNSWAFLKVLKKQIEKILNSFEIFWCFFNIMKFIENYLKFFNLFFNLEKIEIILAKLISAAGSL